MQRRRFLTTASLGSVALAAPAIAQTEPTIQWRMPSSFPRSLDTVWGAAERIAEQVAALTDNRFTIRAFPAGEIVPALQVLDAVQTGAVPCGHTAGFYYLGKQPALAFDTGVPFGLTPRQQDAWLRHGGGDALMQPLYAQFNAIAIPCGNTAPRWVAGFASRSTRSRI